MKKCILLLSLLMSFSLNWAMNELSPAAIELVKQIAAESARKAVQPSTVSWLTNFALTLGFTSAKAMFGMMGTAGALHLANIMYSRAAYNQSCRNGKMIQGVQRTQSEHTGYFTDIQKTQQSHTETLNAMNSGMYNIQATIGSQGIILRSLEEDVPVIKTAVRDIQKDMPVVKTAAELINTKIPVLESTLHSLGGEVTQLQQGIKDLDSKIGEDFKKQNAKLDALKQHMDELPDQMKSEIKKEHEATRTILVKKFDSNLDQIQTHVNVALETGIGVLKTKVESMLNTQTEQLKTHVNVGLETGMKGLKTELQVMLDDKTDQMTDQMKDIISKKMGEANQAILSMKEENKQNVNMFLASNQEVFNQNQAIMTTVTQNSHELNNVKAALGQMQLDLKGVKDDTQSLRISFKDLNKNLFKIQKIVSEKQFGIIASAAAFQGITGARREYEKTPGMTFFDVSNMINSTNTEIISSSTIKTPLSSKPAIGHSSDGIDE